MKSVGIRNTMDYQKLNKVMEIPQTAISGSDGVLDTLESVVYCRDINSPQASASP